MSASIARAARPRRELMTPEGVPINLPVADAGERIAGFAIDGAILLAILIGLEIAVWLASSDGDDGSIGASFVMLAMFLVRNFYFVFFELRWQGQTPGKRRMKTRVIEARGAPLTADAVVARNLVRDVELFLPLSVLLAPDTVWPNVPAWAQAAAGAWAFVVLLWPLFNKQRARIGDLIAGTRVVAIPRAVLLPDLAADRDRPGNASARPVFTADQLDVYGAYELQVLADLLRRKDDLNQHAALDTVYQSICTKLRWQGPPPSNVGSWLEELYAQLRAHLERKMLFGKRKADKHSTDG